MRESFLIVMGFVISVAFALLAYGFYTLGESLHSFMCLACMGLGFWIASQSESV